MMLYGIILINTLTTALTDNRFSDKFHWKNIDYKFPSDKERKMAIESGMYKPGNSFITNIEIWGELLFLATPRLKTGVPSTLNFLNITDTNKSPLLKPYPSWEANNNFNKNSKTPQMISIYSIRADLCHRLWALDTGISDEFETKRIEGPPSVYIYNLLDKTLLRKYSVKDKYYNSESKFRNIVVDVTSGNCENAYAYIADTNYGLIIYNWESNETHKITSNYFSFEPIWGNFKTTKGNLYQIKDGLQGMALSMPNKEGYRELFFHSLAGILEYRISTNILRNETISKDGYKYIYLLGNRGDHMQSSASILDLETGVLLYTTIVKNGIACWNTFRGDSITPENQGIINEFNEQMSYPADIRLDNNGTSWVLTNKMIDFIFEKEMDNTFHIYTGKIHNLINETPCKLI